MDESNETPSAGRSIDIPGTREEDWPTPPLGDVRLKQPSTGRTTDVPGTHATERQTPPPGGGSTSIIGRNANFVNTPEYHQAASRGADLLREGVTKFADWSKRMAAKFGQRIKPHLQRLYFEAKKL